METNQLAHQSQELSIIEKSVEIFKAGGPILTANQNRTSKAVQVGNNILLAIQEQGMTPELDERAKNYLANCAKALKEETEDRAAITQLMDEIKKMFTACEAQIDVKKEGTVPNVIQKHRNDYARKVSEEQKRKEEEARLEAERKTEEINIRAYIEKLFSEHYSYILASAKVAALQKFNETTIENFSDVNDKFVNYSPNFPDDKVRTFYPSVSVRLIPLAAIPSITEQVIKENICDYEAHYNAEMSLYVQELVDKMPSKLSELQEEKRRKDEAERIRKEEEEKARIAEEERKKQLAAAKDAEEKARLEREAEEQRKKEEKRLQDIKHQQEEEQRKADEEKKRREEEEARKIELAKQEEQRKKEEDIKLKADGEKMLTLFEQEAAATIETPAPETRTGIEIIVKHQIGYGQIFQFWFEREGKNMAIDKLGNTNLDQMKSFCEKITMKTGEKIESQFLTYQDTYKAVNRKRKAKPTT